MNNTVELLWTTTDKQGVPHYYDCLKSNPDLTQHVCVSNSKTTPQDIKRDWRNCDNNLRNWWKSNKHIVKSDYLLVVEWDVKITDDIKNYFDFDSNGIICKNIREFGKDKWVWFEESEKFPDHFKNKIKGLYPLSVILFHRSSLDFIIREEFDDIFSKDIFCELRIATILNYGNFEIRGNQRLPDVQLVQSKNHLKYPGIFHKVKTLTL